MSKVTVGQTLYLKAIGNAARRSDAGELKEVTVSKVGKKYFEVDRGHYGRFHIESMYQDGRQYISNWFAYASKEEYENEREANRLYSQIKERFFGTWSGNKLSLDQLKRIEAIVNEKDSQG